MRLTSSLRVGSLLKFPSRGQSNASFEVASLIRYDLKQGSEKFITHSVNRLKEALEAEYLTEILDGDVLLVPVPSSKLLLKDGLWVPKQIAESMMGRGIGSDIACLLKRAIPVRGSSGVSSASNRVTAEEHYESLTVEQTEIDGDPHHIVLVDDVVTMGATLIGCASRINEAFPEVKISAFALARTDGNANFTETREMLEPAIETIELQDSGKTRRR